MARWTRVARSSARSSSSPTIGAYAAIASFGLLLLRALDRATRVHRAMTARLFDGEIRVLRPLAFARGDLLFILAWGGFFLMCRFVNLPGLLSGLAMR